MELEIIKFFVFELDEEKEKLIGNLMIRLPDLGIRILGVFVSRRKDNWFFGVPKGKGTHHETGEAVKYPFIFFEDREKQRAFIDAIREKGRAFIEARLADKETPLIFLKKLQKDLKKVDSQKAKESAAETKEMDSLPKKTVARSTSKFAKA
jgi:hypothetical protein